MKCLDPNNSTAGGDYVCLQSGVPVFGSSPTGVPPFNIFQVPDDFHSGYYHYFHATFQRELFRNNSVTVSYVGSRGNDLVWRKETNAAPLGSPTTGNTDSFRPYFQTFPQYRSIVEFTNDSKSWYDSVQLSYRQNMWHGLNTQYNYTLSKCTDYNSGSRDAATEQATNPYDPSNNKGPCASDIRHNFNASGSYEIPHASLGGGPLQVGAVFSMLSGRPFTPGVGTFDLSGQNTGQLRADCLATPIFNWDLDYLYPGSQHHAVGRHQYLRRVRQSHRRQARHLRPRQLSPADLRAARPEHHQGIQARKLEPAAGAVGDLQPHQSREPRRIPEHQHPQRVVRQDRVDAGRRSRQSGDGIRRAARDAVGVEGAVLGLGLGTRD